MSASKPARPHLVKSDRSPVKRLRHRSRKASASSSKCPSLGASRSSRLRKRRAIPPSESVIYVGPVNTMSSIIDLTKSDSDILVQPSKKRRREAHTLRENKSMHQQPSQRRSIYKCHSLITIKPSDLLATNSSEELLSQSSYLLNSNLGYEYFYNMPASKESAMAYVQAIQNTESAIQLKRTYPFTSVTNIAGPCESIEDSGYGDTHGHSTSEGSNKMVPADGEDDGGVRNAGSDEEDDNKEMLLVGGVVEEIHVDTTGFQVDESEVSVFDVELDSLMNIYGVSPDDKFDN